MAGARAQRKYQDRSARELLVAYEIVQKKDGSSVEWRMQREELPSMIQEKAREEYGEPVAFKLENRLERNEFDAAFDVLDG